MMRVILAGLVGCTAANGPSAEPNRVSVAGLGGDFVTEGVVRDLPMVSVTVHARYETDAYVMLADPWGRFVRTESWPSTDLVRTIEVPEGGYVTTAPTSGPRILDTVGGVQAGDDLWLGPVPPESTFELGPKIGELVVTVTDPGFSVYRYDITADCRAYGRRTGDTFRYNLYQCSTGDEGTTDVLVVAEAKDRQRIATAVVEDLPIVDGVAEVTIDSWTLDPAQVEINVANDIGDPAFMEVSLLPERKEGHRIVGGGNGWTNDGESFQNTSQLHSSYYEPMAWVWVGRRYSEGEGLRLSRLFEPIELPANGTITSLTYTSKDFPAFPEKVQFDWDERRAEVERDSGACRDAEVQAVRLELTADDDRWSIQTGPANTVSAPQLDPRRAREVWPDRGIDLRQAAWETTAVQASWDELRQSPRRFRGLPHQRATETNRGPYCSVSVRHDITVR